MQSMHWYSGSFSIHRPSADHSLKSPAVERLGELLSHRHIYIPILSILFIVSIHCLFVTELNTCHIQYLDFSVLVHVSSSYHIMILKKINHLLGLQPTFQGYILVNQSHRQQNFASLSMRLMRSLYIRRQSVTDLISNDILMEYNAL